MKQEIFDLKLTISKLNQKPKEKEKQLASATTIPSQFNSEKHLPANDSTIDSQGKAPKCKNCKINYEGMA